MPLHKKESKRETTDCEKLFATNTFNDVIVSKMQTKKQKPLKISNKKKFRKKICKGFTSTWKYHQHL